VIGLEEVKKEKRTVLLFPNSVDGITRDASNNIKRILSLTSSKGLVRFLHFSINYVHYFDILCKRDTLQQRRMKQAIVGQIGSVLWTVYTSIPEFDELEILLKISYF